MTQSLHERIRTDIEKQILSGALLPGDHIPSEHELMRTYDCARMTVNRAISALAAADLVERRKGSGTIVSKPRVHSLILDIPDLETDVIERGLTYRWQLVSLQIRNARRADSLELELAQGEKILEIKGVHFSDERPLAVEARLISLASVPEMADAPLETQPPSGWLLTNKPWNEVETRITAIAASADVAEILGLPEGAPCLCLERRTWRGKDPVTHLRQVFNGARHDLFARFQDDDARRRFAHYERQH